MSRPFTPLKQQAFGSIVGGLLRTLQHEHDLHDGDSVTILLSLARGQAGIAGWTRDMWVGWAIRAWDGHPVRPDAPLPPR